MGWSRWLWLLRRMSRLILPRISIQCHRCCCQRLTDGKQTICSVCRRRCTRFPIFERYTAGTLPPPLVDVPAMKVLSAAIVILVFVSASEPLSVIKPVESMVHVQLVAPVVGQEVLPVLSRQFEAAVRAPVESKVRVPRCHLPPPPAFSICTFHVPVRSAWL